MCPYLVGTVWQYGDSEAGGWVYDPSLRVTCPAHPCSRLHCGFRAECRRDRGSGTTSQSSENYSLLLQSSCVGSYPWFMFALPVRTEGDILVRNNSIDSLELF